MSDHWLSDPAPKKSEIPSSAFAENIEASVAKELKKHSDTEISWDKWYCECGFRLRSGYTELAAHRRDVERKLREEATRG